MSDLPLVPELVNLTWPMFTIQIQGGSKNLTMHLHIHGTLMLLGELPEEVAKQLQQGKKYNNEVLPDG